MQADPLVQAVLARFPGAEIVGVHEPGDLTQDEPSAEAAPEPAMPPENYPEDGDWRADEQEDSI